MLLNRDNFGVMMVLLLVFFNNLVQNTSVLVLMLEPLPDVSNNRGCLCCCRDIVRSRRSSVLALSRCSRSFTSSSVFLFELFGGESLIPLTFEPGPART